METERNKFAHTAIEDFPEITSTWEKIISHYKNEINPSTGNEIFEICNDIDSIIYDDNGINNE